MIGAIFTIVWWACVIGTYSIAGRKGRNRFGWTVAAMFVPFLTLVFIALLPDRTKETVS